MQWRRSDCTDDDDQQPCWSFEVDPELELEDNLLVRQDYSVARYQLHRVVTADLRSGELQFERYSSYMVSMTVESVCLVPC